MLGSFWEDGLEPDPRLSPYDAPFGTGILQIDRTSTAVWVPRLQAYSTYSADREEDRKSLRRLQDAGICMSMGHNDKDLEDLGGSVSGETGRAAGMFQGGGGGGIPGRRRSTWKVSRPSGLTGKTGKKRSGCHRGFQNMQENSRKKSMKWEI